MGGICLGYAADLKGQPLQPGLEPKGERTRQCLDDRVNLSHR